MPSCLRSLVLVLATAIACTPTATEGTTSAPPPAPSAAPEEVPMTQASSDPPVSVVAPSSVKVGERAMVPRRDLYGVGLVRPATASELGVLGVPAAGDVPALVVLATEHPDVAPPELQVRDRGGQAALVLTWLARDPMNGAMDEVAEVTYAWTVSGALPRWLVLRKTTEAARMTAELAAEAGPGTPASTHALASATGPAVSLEPSYIVRGTDGFFAQYGQPRPPGVGDGLVLAAVRPTASGRKATAMEAIPLAGGGARVRLTVPIDPGLPVWGPRAGDELATFSSPLPQGAFEWLLELQ